MKKTLQRAGAVGLAAATIVTGLSFGPAAVAAPSTDSAPTSVVRGPLVMHLFSQTYAGVTAPQGSATQNANFTRHSTYANAKQASATVEMPAVGNTGVIKHTATNLCLTEVELLGSWATCTGAANQMFEWADSGRYGAGLKLVGSSYMLGGSDSASYNRLYIYTIYKAGIVQTDLINALTTSYNASDDTVSLKITGGTKDSDVFVEDMAGGNAATGRTDGNGDATIVMSSLLSAGESVRLKYGQTGAWETVSTGRVAAISGLQVVRGDDGKVTVSGTASGSKNADIYVSSDRLSGNAVQTEKAGDDNSFSFVLNDAASALHTAYVYNWANGVRTEITINDLSAKVASTDIPNRTAQVTGTAVPNSFIVVGTDIPDQVQAGPDGTWSYQLTDLRLGSNPVTFEQYEGLEKTGEVTIDAELKVAPVTGAASFPADRDKDAVLSGTAHPGSSVVIRDVEGAEIARTEARLGSGTWSTPISAPNAGGDYDLRVHQEIDGEATGEVIVTVAYGAAVTITSPVEGMAHDGGPVTVRGTGEVGAQVAIREQGRTTILGTATVLANGQWTIRTTNVDDRKHVLEATQTGKGKNTTISTVTLNPENDEAAPADLTLTSHRDGDSFAESGATTLSGKATPNATVTAYWFGKDYPQYATTTTASEQGDYAISRSMGGTQPYNITLTQTAQAGKVNEVTVRLVPNGIGPVDLTVSSHQNGDAFSPTGLTTIRGKASSNATVTFYWFGKDYPQHATTTVANAQGDYSMARGLAGTKPYDIVITQPAQAGKISEVTLRLTPPANGPADLTVSSHQNGDAFTTTGLTTIRGKASSNATVTFYWFGKGLPQYATTTVANAQGDYTMARGLGGTKPYDIVISQPEQAGAISEVTLRLVPTPTP